MARPPPAARKLSWSERGSAAVDAGNLEAAKQCFLEAVKAEGRQAKHRFHLAVVLEGLGEFGAAGARLTEALRIDASMQDAARRLSLLASRVRLPDGVDLDPVGLKAALAYDTVDRERVADVVFRHLAGREPLRGVLEAGRRTHWLEVARGLCLTSTAPLLRDELFLEVLRTSVFNDLDAERLLTALRRVLLLEVPPSRFEDRALVSFVIALMEQGLANEYLWAVSAEEAQALRELSLSKKRLLEGEVASAAKFFVASLYQPYFKTLGSAISPDEVARIRPRALRETVARHLAEDEDERARAARIPRLGTVEDATSRLVAGQYEANPYPRWTSIGLLRPADYRRALNLHFGPQQLAFMDRPFEVLVAGCGTGQQAVQAALAYGPNAQMTAIDLSARSLAYASRMAERFGARNIEFMRADLQELADVAPQLRARFSVIECVGVLHHLADPFKGWRALMDCLAPNGLMLIGLYSATARGDLAALRSDPVYPGPGCSDEALRAFRQVLIERPDNELGGNLRISRDFYATSNFRDLTLHVSERCVTLAEISRFLEDNGLVYRGFLPNARNMTLLTERFPDEPWPGSLARWAELEEAHPFIFNGMYILWCERA